MPSSKPWLAIESSALPWNNLLIVGDTSYIGSYIARLSERAGARVIGVSRQVCDLLDAEQCAHFFAGLPPEKWTVVFLSVINKTAGNDYDAFERNVRMVRNFAQAQRSASIDGVVYFSSVDVYGRNPEIPITENSQIQPDTWYGLAKYDCEWILRSSGDVECPVTILRIPGVYGPAKNDRSVIGQLVRSICDRNAVSIRGSGQALRDYVFIGDVAEIVRRLATAQHEGVVNVATGKSHSIQELALLAGEVLNQEFQIEREPADSAREFDLVFDNRRLLSLTAGFTFTDISNGLRSYAC